MGAVVLARRAPLGAACGLMLIAGIWWGNAATREQSASCAGRWNAAATHAAVVRLNDPAPAAGGVVEAVAQPGRCGGSLLIRWPDGHAAHGGTTWVVAGRFLRPPDARSGVLVARRVRQLDASPHGRGALRDRIAERSRRLFGTRAPLVDALVIARRAELDAELRERYTRAGLAHLLSISGLHVGFFAAWLNILLVRLRLGPRARFAAGAGVLLRDVLLLGFFAPPARSGAVVPRPATPTLRPRPGPPPG